VIPSKSRNGSGASMPTTFRTLVTGH
jgi:hypothetical protein